MDEFFFSLKIPLRIDGLLPIQPMSWSMAAMLRDSTTVVVVVVRTRPRAIPLAMIHMRKSIHGFPFVPLYGYGAPLGGLRPPELCYYLLKRKSCLIIVELFIGERKRSKRRHSFKNFKCLYSKSRDSVQSTNYNDFNITTSPPLKLQGVAKTTKHEGNKV